MWMPDACAAALTAHARSCPRLLPFPLIPCPCCPPPDAELETFYREAALLSRLHHRNIVQVQWAVRWALGGVYVCACELWLRSAPGVCCAGKAADGATSLLALHLHQTVGPGGSPAPLACSTTALASSRAA